MVDDRNFDWVPGALYLLDDGQATAVARLIDLQPGPEDYLLLEMELIHSLNVPLVRGVVILCPSAWVKRRAIDEDLPPAG